MKSRRLGLALLALAGGAASLRATNGHMLHGVGPVNQAMGGAGTAAFLDPLGVARWNPAGMVQLEGRGGLELGLEYFRPDRSVSSSVQAGAFGAGRPPVGFRGETDSATEAAVLPAFAWYQKRGEDAAIHVALLGVAGFGVEYPQDPRNPILTPGPPNGLGFGAVSSEYQLAKLVLGYSRKLSSRLGVGVGLVPSLAKLNVSPAPFASPDDANGDGSPGYPSASHSEESFGVGFQLGASYAIPKGWTFGFAYQGPVRFDEFEWDAQDELGNPRRLAFRLDFPATIGLGVSRRPNPEEFFALDLRYIPYQRTKGFEEQGFDATGRVQGFGWEDTLVFGVGYQRQLDERWTMRAGYNHNDNPVPDEAAFFNVPAPAIVEHRVSVGATRQLREGHAVHMAAYHAFENRHTGQFVGPMGPAPGTTVESRLREDSVSFAYARRW